MKIWKSITWRAVCALLMGTLAGVHADELPDLTVTYQRGNGTVAPQYREDRRITVRSVGESEIEITKGADPAGKKVSTSAFTPDPARLKALIEYIRANHLDTPPSSPAVRTQPRPGDGTCLLYMESRGASFALPCGGPLTDMIRDIVPAALAERKQLRRRPAFTPPVIFGGGNPDLVTVALRLDADFSYELNSLGESIRGPVRGSARTQKGRWVYDEQHSIVTLSPSDPTAQGGSLTIVASSPLTGRLEGAGLPSVSLTSEPLSVAASGDQPDTPPKDLPAKGIEVRDIAIKTIDGHFLTAADGGGYGGPDNGPAAVALHSDATTVGPWETFEWVWLDHGHTRFALKTPKGTFITAVNGGGIGGPNDGRSPVHTDATHLDVDEVYRLTLEQNGKATLRTRKGFYITAVDGGGLGGPNTVPIHSDATTIGPWETFRLVPR